MHKPSFDFVGTTPFSAPERRAHARGAQGKLADTLRARVHTFSCFMAERFGKPTQAGVIDGVGNGRKNARDQIAQRSEHCAARWRGRKQKQGCRRWSPSDLHFVRDQSRDMFRNGTSVPMLSMHREGPASGSSSYNVVRAHITTNGIVQSLSPSWRCLPCRQ